jgi:hypothetical protein
VKSEVPTPAPHPAWVECPHCDDFVCTVHDCHTHESGCECPPVEDWLVDPYSEGGNAVSLEFAQALLEAAR